MCRSSYKRRGARDGRYFQACRRALPRTGQAWTILWRHRITVAHVSSSRDGSLTSPPPNWSSSSLLGVHITSCDVVLSCSLVCLSWSESKIGPDPSRPAVNENTLTRPSLIRLALNLFHKIELNNYLSDTWPNPIQPIEFDQRRDSRFDSSGTQLWSRAITLTKSIVTSNWSICRTCNWSFQTFSHDNLLSL